MSDVVLVTGFPSLLARTVCTEIVQSDPQTRVRAVVRPKFLTEAASFLQELPVDQRDRVAVVEGDAAAIDLGLSGLEIKALSREITHIHHCDQVTHLGVEGSAAQRVNVGGAQEAIEIASSCPNLASLVFHSTAHVSGDRTGTVREDELKAGQSFRTVVEETKARAEKVMRGAMDRVPICVVRPATIVGDSRTGEVDRFDGPYLLILLVVTSPPDLALPLPGPGEEALNLVPIDWVARASVALGRDPRARGRTFHLVDPQPFTARKVFELVARAGGRRSPRGSIPANLAKALLRAPGLDRIAKSPRALLETLTTSVTYDAANADELLVSLGVPACPPLESYVDKLVEYVKEHVKRRRAVKAEEEAAAVEVEDPLV
ncbi:MAG TPA: SDR family oxidoreductase [Polyangiaceae bacterium]|jgi:thioester reductase-like protein|nr:SDR family oxidoreductase [Polyangiaceae bacterium]